MALNTEAGQGYPDDEVRITAATALVSGQAVVRGTRLGIYQGLNSAAIGDKVSLQNRGVVKMGAVTTDVWSDGDEVNFVAASNLLTDAAVAGGITRAGLAVGDKANGETEAWVELNARA